MVFVPLCNIYQYETVIFGPKTVRGEGGIDIKKANFYVSLENKCNKENKCDKEQALNFPFQVLFLKLLLCVQINAAIITAVQAHSGLHLESNLSYKIIGLRAIR